MTPTERITELRLAIQTAGMCEIDDLEGELDMLLRGDLPDWIEDEPGAFNPEDGSYALGMTPAEYARFKAYQDELAALDARR